MNTLKNMRIFVRVADAASFAGAARALDMTTAQASKAVSELEAHLRTRLLHRTTRKLALTDAGHRYLARCRDIIAMVDVSEAEAGAATAAPSGTLRLHAPASFGQVFVIPALARFLEQYPEVQADLLLSSRVPDLLEENIDVSLRLATAQLPDSGLVSTRICRMASVLCAAPLYLEMHGAPGSLEDLAQHTQVRLVAPHYSVDHWHFEGPDGRVKIPVPAGRLRVNTADSLAAALISGCGVGPVPLLSALPALRSGALVRVLPDYELQGTYVYAVYASRLYLDAKVKSWIEFLRAFVEQALAAPDAAALAPHTR
ncbi:LysR family transcriptional regulator [Pandoraea pneumonica]|jgi:DNA-binding transcriptional LysR family regulator|uniref:LysR family transcriptional regulator n=1 Tax=Pandoraea pneumonica TaxID=2508299 RepID=A0A5E4W9Q1_9BURK|nr:LysR family transcriptional regulator [Pandoraea pneumonica]VVE21727.1 LysR family transcriptional regulator [Pandoraea pneumonica]